MPSLSSEPGWRARRPEARPPSRRSPRDRTAMGHGQSRSDRTLEQRPGRRPDRSPQAHQAPELRTSKPRSAPAPDGSRRVIQTTAQEPRDRAKLDCGLCIKGSTARADRDQLESPDRVKMHVKVWKWSCSREPGRAATALSTCDLHLWSLARSSMPKRSRGSSGSAKRSRF